MNPELESTKTLGCFCLGGRRLLFVFFVFVFVFCKYELLLSGLLFLHLCIWSFPLQPDSSCLFQPCLLESWFSMEAPVSAISLMSQCSSRSHVQWEDTCSGVQKPRQPLRVKQFDQRTILFNLLFAGWGAGCFLTSKCLPDSHSSQWTHNRAIGLSVLMLSPHSVPYRVAFSTFPPSLLNKWPWAGHFLVRASVSPIGKRRILHSLDI